MSRLVAVVLLVAGAGLFVLGTSLESGRHHDVADETGGSHTEGGQSDEHGEGAATVLTENRTSAETTILGIDRESTGLVVLAVAASLALAALLWLRPSRSVWAIAGLAALAFAVFDIAEVVHQLDESASGLATVAASVAAAHMGVTALATRSALPRRVAA
jgi:hypothetical protein